VVAGLMAINGPFEICKNVLVNSCSFQLTYTKHFVHNISMHDQVLVIQS
jgi:hypothetical protein